MISTLILYLLRTFLVHYDSKSHIPNTVPSCCCSFTDRSLMTDYSNIKNDHTYIYMQVPCVVSTESSVFSLLDNNESC